MAGERPAIRILRLTFPGKARVKRMMMNKAGGGKDLFIDE